MRPVPFDAFRKAGLKVAFLWAAIQRHVLKGQALACVTLTTLAQELGCGTDTVRRRIRKAVAAGLLEVEERPGQSMCLTLRWRGGPYVKGNSPLHEGGWLRIADGLWGADLTENQKAILAYAASREKPTSEAAFSRWLNLPKGTVHRVLHELRKAGFLTWEHRPSKKNRYGLTDKSKALLAALPCTSERGPLAPVNGGTCKRVRKRKGRNPPTNPPPPFGPAQIAQQLGIDEKTARGFLKCLETAGTASRKKTFERLLELRERFGAEALAAQMHGVGRDPTVRDPLGLLAWRLKRNDEVARRRARVFASLRGKDFRAAQAETEQKKRADAEAAEEQAEKERQEREAERQKREAENAELDGAFAALSEVEQDNIVRQAWGRLPPTARRMVDANKPLAGGRADMTSARPLGQILDRLPQIEPLRSMKPRAASDRTGRGAVARPER